MKQKLIKLSDTHYIVVDNFEKPVINDFIIDINNPKSIRQIKTNYLLEDLFENEKKITHSTQKLYKNDFWAIKELNLSEVEEVIYGYNIEKLFLDWELKNGNCYNNEDTAFKDGFNTHKEIVKDKFILTKEQIRFIYNTAIYAVLGKLNLDEEFNRVLKFISSKTEWDIEFDEQNKIKLV